MIDRQKWAFVKANIMPAFRRLLLDRPSPMFVVMYVTRKCNLKCSYCFFRKDCEDPSLDILKKRIDKVKEIGCNSIYIMGGEPTLREDMAEIIGYCNKKGIFTVMNTNGRLLNKEIIDNFADAGLNSLVVSLDGIKKVNQSKKTLFDNPKLLGNLNYASVNKGIRIFINVVLTGNNTKEIIPLLEKAKENKLLMTTCLVSQEPEHYMSKGTNTNFSKKQIKEFNKLFDEIIEKRKQGYPVFEPPHCYEKMKEFINGKYVWKCNTCRHFLSVDCDGFVSPCPETQSLGIDFMKMDKNYYKKHKKAFEDHLKLCNKACLQNYAVCEGYYSENKMKFMGGA